MGHQFMSIVTEETSPPVSMKSKATGLNFMVSVGRAIEQGDNALAKLLQASQEMVRFMASYKPSYFILKDNLAQALLHTNRMVILYTNLNYASLATKSSLRDRMP